MKGEAGTTSAGCEAKRRASTSRLDFVGDGQDGGGRGGAAPVHPFCYAHAAGQLNQVGRGRGRVDGRRRTAAAPTVRRRTAAAAAHVGRWRDARGTHLKGLGIPVGGAAGSPRRSPARRLLGSFRMVQHQHRHALFPIAAFAFDMR